MLLKYIYILCHLNLGRLVKARSLDQENYWRGSTFNTYAPVKLPGQVKARLCMYRVKRLGWLCTNTGQKGERCCFAFHIFNNHVSIAHSEKKQQQCKTPGLARCLLCRALDPGTSWAPCCTGSPAAAWMIRVQPNSTDMWQQGYKQLPLLRHLLL